MNAAGSSVAPATLPRRWLTPTLWGTLLLLLGVASTGAVVLYRGDSEGALRVANQELDYLLERDETVLARAPVYQRIWWDYFRHTYGVMAATNRRLMFVGVPPDPLLHREPGPVELVDASFLYARGVSVVQRAARGRMIRLRVASGSQQEELAAFGRDADRVRAVIDSSDGRQAGLRAVADAERRAIEVASAASRRPTYHLTQRGEALDGIARRYGTLSDSIIAWNNLPSPRIVVGQRLLVRRGQAP